MLFGCCMVDSRLWSRGPANQASQSPLEEAVPRQRMSVSLMYAHTNGTHAVPVSAIAGQETPRACQVQCTQLRRQYSTQLLNTCYCSKHNADVVHFDAIVGEPVPGDDKCLANCTGAGYNTSTQYCGGVVTAGREPTYYSFLLVNDDRDYDLDQHNSYIVLIGLALVFLYKRF
ncbi:hypothetical protein ColLi_12988 [Colletotrichum liriopes]|uniref:WSC domain-containing protein n=1 Tax=Colletotrichum liriopes TaxID=708192 RepID=A0AA37H0N6_9PEZI|nr:hypothetical protein ColLi_12988 [Colletotrichum liriopes]